MSESDCHVTYNSEAGSWKLIWSAIRNRNTQISLTKPQSEWVRGSQSDLHFFWYDPFTFLSCWRLTWMPASWHTLPNFPFRWGKQSICAGQGCLACPTHQACTIKYHVGPFSSMWLRHGIKKNLVLTFICEGFFFFFPVSEDKYFYVASYENGWFEIHIIVESKNLYLKVQTRRSMCTEPWVLLFVFFFSGK